MLLLVIAGVFIFLTCHRFFLRTSHLHTVAAESPLAFFQQEFSVGRALEATAVTHYSSVAFAN